MQLKQLFAGSLLSVLSLFVALQPVQTHAQTSCPNTPTNPDTISTTFSVPETNTYAIWSRIFAPDTTNNSFYLQIDGGCAFNVGDGSGIPANAFTWVNYQNGNPGSQILVVLAGGTHTLKVTEREGGVGIDNFLVTTNTTCIPTGFGTNCPLPTSTPVVINTPTATITPVFPTNTQAPILTPKPTPIADMIAPTVTITAPANGSTVRRNSSTTLAATAIDNVAVRQVQFSVTGKGSSFSCTATTLPYSCNWLVPSKPSTSYTITAVVTDTSGNTNSASIRVTSSR